MGKPNESLQFDNLWDKKSYRDKVDWIGQTIFNYFQNSCALQQQHEERMKVLEECQKNIIAKQEELVNVTRERARQHGELIELLKEQQAKSSQAAFDLSKLISKRSAKWLTPFVCLFFIAAGLALPATAILYFFLVKNGVIPSVF